MLHVVVVTTRALLLCPADRWPAIDGDTTAAAAAAAALAVAVSATPVAARSTPKAVAAAAIDDGDHTDERIARIQGRQRWRRHSYPTPGASPSRVFVSSLRPSTRLLVHGGSRRRWWSFYSFLPSLSVARSRPEQSRARAQRYCITAGQTMRESRRKRARDTGKRDDERERERVTHYHHLAYAPLGATSGRGEKERWRKKETRKEGEKAARLPLSHARTLRHFDTSDTTASSTSCTTPSSFFYRVFRDA